MNDSDKDSEEDKKPLKKSNLDENKNIKKDFQYDANESFIMCCCFDHADPDEFNDMHNEK